MKVAFRQRSYDFEPWTPAKGRVFSRSFAFDCETTRIDEERPYLPPAYVIGAAFDGKRGYYVLRKDVAAFFAAHQRLHVVFHNAAFDLAVIHTLAPQLGIYTWVDRNEVWDTYLLHRLYILGTQGHTAGGKGESDLEHCAKVYLETDLPKDITDSKGDLVRLSYGKWLNQPPQKIELVYLEYLAKDVIATWQLFSKLKGLMNTLLCSSDKVWGYVSEDWLVDCAQLWGPQTHHIQLRGSIVLKEISRNGLHLDIEKRAELVQALDQHRETKRKILHKHGYLPGEKGSNKALQGIMRRLERQFPEMTFHRTDTAGLYATSFEALQDLVGVVPFIQTLLEYREVEKLLNSFLSKMGRKVLHPSFNVMARSGRTSSFGEINAQNLPTDDRVRACFVPPCGKVYVDADFSTIELATLAQACIGQFGLDSQMAKAINDEKDLHTLVAARVTGKPEEDVTKEERKKAKPINFGKPGGMGDATMRQYAKVSYKVLLSEAEVKDLSDAWHALFPEMKVFLADTGDTPLELAKLLNLTPALHHRHTDDTRFVRHPENAGKANLPNAILGCMLLKVVKSSSPQTRVGKRYSASDIDFFWSRLEAKASLLGPKFQQDILQRQPSTRLQRAVMGLVGRAGVFTFTGRLRANASYSARHNTVFQGLAADGAKLALWLLWRAGYRIVNFIHDQVLVEVPANSDLKSHAEKIRSLMIEGMKGVLPDVRVDVKYAATDRWYKDAEAVFSKDGETLLLWHPKIKEKAVATAI
jgi:DNA polymerase I-like protein with 3'-5' exonuclease and polymerase domains